MVQFLSIIFFFLDFFNFCWVFQKFPFFCVTLYYAFDAQMFLQPLFLPNREHIMSHYIFDAQVFLWPQSESHREEACGLFTHVLRAKALYVSVADTDSYSYKRRLK